MFAYVFFFSLLFSPALQFPFFCSDREYTIGRRIWDSGRTYYCVTKVRREMDSKSASALAFSCFYKFIMFVCFYLFLIKIFRCLCLSYGSCLVPKSLWW